MKKYDVWMPAIMAAVVSAAVVGISEWSLHAGKSPAKATLFVVLATLVLTILAARKAVVSRDSFISLAFLTASAVAWSSSLYALFLITADIWCFVGMWFIPLVCTVFVTGRLRHFRILENIYDPTEDTADEDTQRRRRLVLPVLLISVAAEVIGLSIYLHP